MNFTRLLNDNILVELEPRPEKTKGGIVIPDTQAISVRTGIVRLTGEGKYYTDKYVPVEVKVGERVVFLIGSVDTRSGQAVVKHLHVNEVLIREVDILFVIPQDSKLEVTQ